MITNYLNIKTEGSKKNFFFQNRVYLGYAYNYQM